MINNSVIVVCNQIKKWLDESKDLTYREEEQENLNSDINYKLWIFFKDGKTISISLIYPKNYSIHNCLILGWKWRLDDIDKEALSRIKDSEIKESFIRLLKNDCESKNFKLTIDLNGDFFNNILISKELLLEKLSENYFLSSLIDLSLAWAFVMNNFDFQNIQRRKITDSV